MSKKPAADAEPAAPPVDLSAGAVNEDYEPALDWILGSPCLYLAPSDHRTDQGSVYHPDLKLFAGLVTRIWPHERGLVDLVIFVPGQTPLNVSRVKHGGGSSRWRMLGENIEAGAPDEDPRPHLTGHVGARA